MTNNNDDSAVARDQAAKEAAIEAKLREQKNSASDRSRKNSDFPAASGPYGQEAGLTERKSPAATSTALGDPLQDAALELAKQQLKKRIWLWIAAPIAGFFASTAWIWIPALIILFVVGITYNYWTNHPYSPSLYYYSLTMQPEKLIMDAINDTYSSDYAGTVTEDEDSSKAPTAASAVGQSAEGADSANQNGDMSD